MKPKSVRVTKSQLLDLYGPKDKSEALFVFIVGVLIRIGLVSLDRATQIISGLQLQIMGDEGYSVGVPYGEIKNIKGLYAVREDQIAGLQKLT